MRTGSGDKEIRGIWSVGGTRDACLLAAWLSGGPKPAGEWGGRFLTPPTPTPPECVTRLCRPRLPWLWMFACLHSPTFRQVSNGSCSCVLGSWPGAKQELKAPLNE